MRNVGPRLRSIALALVLAAVVLVVAGVVSLFWEVSSTDNGMVCDASDDKPLACSVYGLWVVLLGLAALSSIGALLSFVGSIRRTGSRTR